MQSSLIVYEKSSHDSVWQVDSCFNFSDSHGKYEISGSRRSLHFLHFLISGENELNLVPVLHTKFKKKSFRRFCLIDLNIRCWIFYKSMECRIIKRYPNTPMLTLCL